MRNPSYMRKINSCMSLVAERYFNTVVHNSEGMETNQGLGGPGSNGSSGAQTPPSRTPPMPLTPKSQSS